MEVRIDKDIFLDGVQKVQGIAETKGAMPILSHLLLTAEKDRIGIQATDLEIGAKGYYSANVITAGEVTLSAKKLFVDGNKNNCAFHNLKTVCANCQRLASVRKLRWKIGDLEVD